MKLKLSEATLQNVVEANVNTIAQADAQGYPVNVAGMVRSVIATQAAIVATLQAAGLTTPAGELVAALEAAGVEVDTEA